MAVTTVKLAISLPKETYRKMEALRRARKVARSLIYSEAVNDWLALIEKKKLVERYIEGYRRIPESVEHQKALEQAQADALGGGEWI